MLFRSVYSVDRSTNTIRIFLNGRQVYSLTNATSIPSTGRDQTSTLAIGARQGSGTYGSFLKATVDEARLYNVARNTEALAQADMNTWGPTSTTSLDAYFDFNEGSGTTAANTSTTGTKGPDMTLANSPTWGDVKSVSTTGPYVVTTFPRSYLTSAGGWTVPTGVTKVDSLVKIGRAHV